MSVTYRNESSRLNALMRYQIVDTESEISFDDLCEMAAELFGVPMASIGFVEENRVWIKARVGMDVSSEVPRSLAMCAHTILRDGVTEIVGHELAKCGLIVGAPVKFYAGAPICTPEGFRIGAVAIVDVEARRLTEKQKTRLLAIARQIEVLLELRLRVAELRVREGMLRAQGNALSQLDGTKQIGEIIRAKREQRLGTSNKPEARYEMGSEDLRKVIAQHSRWLLDGTGCKADLSNCDLRGQVLHGADLAQATCVNTDFSGAYLTGANLYGIDARHADFTDAHLAGSWLSGSDLGSATLKNADLSGAEVMSSRLYQADLYRAKCVGTIMVYSDLTEACLIEADLTEANLELADLTGADLTGATLTRSMLKQTCLRNASLRDATLLQTNMQYAILNGADLLGAVLVSADITGTDGRPMQARRKVISWDHKAQ